MKLRTLAAVIGVSRAGRSGRARITSHDSASGAQQHQETRPGSHRLPEINVS